MHDLYYREWYFLTAFLNKVFVMILGVDVGKPNPFLSMCNIPVTSDIR